MDRTHHTELISAYLDGEVSPQERAEVERLLEESPEFRADLDDFARLSDLIRGLPRESAPAELATAIRQQAERQALIGPEPTPPKRSLRREILAALSGMAVTAAACLVAVNSLREENARRAPLVMREFRLPAGAPTEAAPADVSLTMRSVSSSPDGAALESEQSHFDQAPLAAKIAGTQPVPPPEMPLAATDAFNATMALDERLPESNLSRDSDWLGGVVTYFEPATNNVPVLEFTVMDVDDIGGQLEVLLLNNGLEVISDGRETMEAGKPGFAGKKMSTSQDANHLKTVYVDAPRDKIAQVLDTMVQQKLFSQARLQPPVEASLALLADESKPSEPADTESKRDAPLVPEPVVEEALGVTQNYAARNYGNVGVEELEKTRRSPISAKEHQSRSRTENFRKDRFNRVAKDPAGKTGDFDAPASAAAPQMAGRGQKAVVMDLNSDTGVISNGFIAQQSASAPAAAALKQNLKRQEKMKSAPAPQPAEDRAADKDGERSLAEGTAPAAEPMIRVLLVLRKAESTEAP